MRRLLALLALFVLIAGACGSGDGGGEDADGSVDADETSDTDGDSDADDESGEVETGDADETATDGDDEVSDTPAVVLPDYQAEAAGIVAADNDRDLPNQLPESPIGSYGYSRYVYTQSGDQVIPTLVEGPLGYQTRCQEADQDCSYLELKALYESGEDLPSYLGMDRDTLGELVSQLDRTAAALEQYPDIDDACAAGFRKSTNQVANMGIHMIDPGAGRDFDPDRPQMVLFAQESGFGLGRDTIGTCVDGAWTGEPGYEPVGAVFNIALSEEHPDGFAGPIDNWHIHYNTCIGRTQQAAAEAEGLDPEETGEAEGARSSTTREACESSGGRFLEVIPSWMMHAYVAEDFDAQTGVFSMFNPTIWPLSDADSLADSRVVAPVGDVEAAPILNFDFGEISVGVGETVRFSNSDSVPHTVTAGSFIEPSDEFDSGLLTTGEAWDIEFDEPGSYELFCVLHPDMVGTVNVE